jgi:PAS domain S-box-containing protein
VTVSDQKDIPLSAFRITLIYLFVAGLWIAFTDSILASLVDDPEYLSALQTYKGWFYVAITGLGLYWLIKTYSNQFKAQQEELEAEKELSDILFERIPVLITIYDPDLQQFEVNKEFEKVTGWKNEEIIEDDVNLMKRCYPNKEYREEVVTFMSEPGIGWKEFDMNAKSGEPIPISWTNIRLTDNTSVGIGIDMSEIKSKQTEIRESRKLLKKIFESLKSSLIVVDPQSRTIVDCNRATEDLFGYAPSELIGSSTRKLHVDQDHYRKFDVLGMDALENSGVFQTEFKMQKKDGTIFYSDHTVTLVYSEDGNVDKAISVIRDITEQKEYEQQLKQQQERLLDSQRIGQIGDWEYDPEQDAIYWSPTMYDIFDRDPELGPPSFDDLQTSYFGHDTKRYNREVKKALENGDPYELDLHLKTDTGNERYVHAIGIPISDDSGNVTKLRGVVQDITDRKTTEIELEERNEFIEITLENLPIGVAVNTIDDGQTTLINQRFTEIYGWPREVLEDVDTFFEKVYPDPEFRQRIKQQVMEDLQSSEPERMNWTGIPIETKEGDEKYVNNKAIPLYDQNLMISTVIDVTEQEELEKELKREKQRFELVAETTSDVIWDLDVEQEKLWWSEGFEKLFGYEREDQHKNFESWINYIHPEDRPKIEEISRKKLASSDQEWQEEYRILKKDGTVAHIVDSAIIIRDDDGAPLRMVGAMQDITERRKAQQQLRESEKKYRLLFENNPEPMWIYDPDTLNFIEVNKAAVNHYGYLQEEFLNMSLLDIHPPENAEALKENVEKNRGQDSYAEDWVHLQKDGTKINVEVSSTDVKYGKHTYRLVLSNDVTEQKKLQEKIIQSVIEGEDRERKRIAHELHDGLGQYLVAANMNFQSARQDADQLPPKRQQQFGTGLSLLKEALSETRSIAHNLMPKAITDYGLVAALQNLFKDLENSTGIEFHFHHNVDELRLQNQAEVNLYRIIQEAISNAVRHANCSTIRTTLQRNADSLTVEIEDDGIGMELQDHHKEKGLGLRSIKNRVKSLNGTINFESEQSEGILINVAVPDLHTLTAQEES